MFSSTVTKKSASLLMLPCRVVQQKAASMGLRAAAAVMARRRFVATTSTATKIDDSWLTKPIPTADLREFSYAAPSYSHSLSGFGQAAPELTLDDDTWRRTTPITNTASLFEFSYAAPTWSQSLSFASPESDFTAATGGIKVQQHSDKEDYPQTSQPPLNEDLMSMVNSPETASGNVAMTEFLNDDLIQQLLRQQQHDHHDIQVLRPYEQLDSILPKTLQDVFHDEHDPRAMVVTKVSEPFEIVDVNEAWVGLCGYTQDESRHKTLSTLLQGPETDTRAVKQCVQSLLEGKHPASTTITNYTKSGRKFTNQLTMGPLYDNHDQLTHFVGVLQEVRQQ